MSEHVIELNGKRYDAITGAKLNKSSAVPARTKKVIDGFMRQTAPKKPAKPAAPPKTDVKKAASKLHPDILEAVVQKPAAARSHTIHPSAKRQPEHSKTLMRTTVKRPDVTRKPAIKPQPPAEVMAKPVSAIARKHSVTQVDAHRMERAIHIPKHGAITRFHHEGTPVTTYASAERAMAPIPVIAVRQAPAVTPRKTAAVQPRSTDIFEAAMHRATSHKEPAHKPARHKLRRRLINTFAGMAAFLVLAGFIGYLNMPTLELRVASMQAGFRASIPDYRPTGYALTGGVQRIGGTVSVSFKSGASNYTITQQASDWNSQTLLDNTLALAGSYQTVQKNGQTIYIYDNSANAAWVNGGIRYDLTGNATLSKDDIASIATSL